MISRRTPAVLTALLAMVAVLTTGLTACSGAGRPDAAAVVNGTVITTREVRVATDEISAMLGQPVEEGAVLQRLIVAEFVIDEAARSGVWVPDNAYNTLLAKLPSTQEVSRRTLEADFARTALEQAGRFEPILAQLSAATIDVSPRYGSWDPRTAQLATTTPDWIVTPKV